MLVCSMIDQLCATSDSQFSLLTKQLHVLRESSNAAQSLHIPTSSVEAVDAEHTVIIEGLCVKVKGLCKQLSRNATQSWDSGTWLSILVSELIHL